MQDHQNSLFSSEELARLDLEFSKAQKKTKDEKLHELRQKLDLVYYKEPATNNDLMINLQFEYLRKGSEAAKTKLWIMAFQMVENLLNGEAARRRLYLTQDEKDEKISRAVIDVMKRYEKIYYAGTKEQKKAKLYPFAYCVKNYVFQFQKAIQKQLDAVVFHDVKFEGLENLEAITQENTNFEELMRDALLEHFKGSPLLHFLQEEETMQDCINFIKTKARETTEEKEIPQLIIYLWADDFLQKQKQTRA